MARSLVTTLMEQFHNLTEVEQKVFLDLVDPQPEPAAPAKQTRKRTKRAEPLSDERRKAVQKRGLPLTDDAKSAEPVPVDADAGGLCGVCGNPDEYLDHFQPSPNYHPFEAPKVKKAAK